MATPAVTPEAPAIDINTPATEIAAAVQAAQPVVEPVVAPPIVETPAPAEAPPYAVGKEGEQYVVTLKTGERYLGATPEAAMIELAKALVSTKDYARTLKEAKPAEPVVTPPVVTPPTPEVYTAEQFFAQAAENPQNAVKMALAQSFGMTLAELDGMVASLPRVVETVQTQSAQAQSENVVGQFLSRAEDFPNTEEATGKLLSKLQAMGLPEGSQITPETLQAAHLLCVQGKDYVALSSEQVQAVRNKAMGQVTARTQPNPPPMVTPQAPNSGDSEVDLMKIPLDQLRQMAVQQRG